MYTEFSAFKQAIFSQPYRKDMVDCGIEHAKQFLEKHDKDAIKEETPGSTEIAKDKE
jgi:hypothetical protein